MNGKIARLILLLIPAAATYAQIERLTLNLWCDLEPPVFEGGEYPLSAETAAQKLLEEARTLFSAMIYGYRFTYTPYDRARDVQEEFGLDPIAEIPWGDPGLKIIRTEVQDKRFYGKLYYHLKDYQFSRISSWETNTLPTSQGQGEDSFLKGQTAKIGSFQEAVKQAIREYARKRIYNKPKRITGEVLLVAQPHTIIDSGAYLTQVKIKLFIDTLTPYLIF